MTTFRKSAKLATMQRLLPLQNAHFGSKAKPLQDAHFGPKIKIVKNMRKATLEPH